MTHTVAHLSAWIAVLATGQVMAQAAQPDFTQDPTPAPEPVQAPEPGTASGQPEGEPPPEYYVEPASEPESSPPEPGVKPPSVDTLEPAPADPQTARRPIPVYEPPPPPMAQHISPRQSLWIGAKMGWFVPFGDLWGYCINDAYMRCVQVDARPWRHYAGPGPMVELDVGARLGRHYNIFALWERAVLGIGTAFEDDYGGQRKGDSDFWGAGVRVSSNPDEVGLLVEFALGYRRARARWEDGVELRLTEAPFEARIGLGADVRLSQNVSLSPLATVGVGRFEKAQWVRAGRSGADILDSFDAFSHGWFTLQLGAHFDVAGVQ